MNFKNIFRFPSKPFKLQTSTAKPFKLQTSNFKLFVALAIAFLFTSLARAQTDVFTIITRPVEDAYANPFGLPTTQCDDLSIPLQLLANLPDGHSGEWRIISGPRQDPPNQSEFAGFFGDYQNNNTTFTSLKEGIYVVEWTLYLTGYFLQPFAAMWFSFIFQYKF